MAIHNRSIIGAIFACQQCGREWQDYLTAQDAARRHANSTGHQVTGEVVLWVQYNRAAQSGTEPPHG